MLVAVNPKLKIAPDMLRERLRARFHRDLPDVQISFEAGDIVSQVMSFGSPTQSVTTATRTSTFFLIAIMSSIRSMKIKDSIASRWNNSPATCCRNRPKKRESLRASIA